MHLLLDFSYIPYPHGGKEIASKTFGTITKFNIEKKVVSLTSDNASNNIKAIKVLQDLLKDKFIIPSHQRCLAHINLSVQEGLKEVFELNE